MLISNRSSESCRFCLAHDTELSKTGHNAQAEKIIHSNPSKPTPQHETRHNVQGSITWSRRSSGSHNALSCPLGASLQATGKAAIEAAAQQEETEGRAGDERRELIDGGRARRPTGGGGGKRRAVDQAAMTTRRGGESRRGAAGPQRR
jgi:hypothetical protein